LVRLVWNLKPDVVHPYLTQNNVKVSLLRFFYPGTPVVWGVRATSLNLGDYGIRDRIIAWLGRQLSPRADTVICNSTGARDEIVGVGLRPGLVHVVPNGIDADRFRQLPAQGQAFKERYLSGHSGQVVGMLARWDPMKGQGAFLEMAALLVDRLPDCMFVLVGRCTQEQEETYLANAHQMGLSGHLVLVGEVDNSIGAINSFDVLVSCSRYGEGFSNVIAEAMACGVPVVATDVGDAGLIVGDLCPVVPAGDVEAIAEATCRLLEVGSVRPDDLRERVVSNYSVDNLVDATLRLLSNLNP
jgi:glycosyltransferase involved in cell wall biosynthesis